MSLKDFYSLLQMCLTKVAVTSQAVSSFLRAYILQQQACLLLILNYPLVIKDSY